MKGFGNIVSDIFNRPVYILTERWDSEGDGIVSCMTGGEFWTVMKDGDRLQFDRIDSATAEIQGYASGVAETYGIRLDSGNPYEELAGYLRLDVKCSGGNKPCGKTCIPQRYECRVKGGGLKSGGSKKARSGKAVAAGAAGIAGGALAAGALGAAGYVGIKSKDTIKRGAKAIAEETKRGVKEAKGDIKEGVEEAKFGKALAKAGIKSANEQEKIANKVFDKARELDPNSSTQQGKKRTRQGRRGISSTYRSERGKAVVEGGGYAASALASGAEEAARTTGRTAKKVGKLAGQTTKNAVKNAFRGKKKKKEESSSS